MLTPGGRLGLTAWGHLKKAPGAWAMAPFRLAAQEKVDNQAAMQLGRPGSGEDLLARVGFTDIQRIDIRMAWEFADPETYARALASTGPAYEAIQHVGEAAFIESAEQQAREQLRSGLPLRALLPLVGYLATKPVQEAK